MHLFFDNNIHEQTTFLPPDESGHAVRVLRLKAGDEIGILNGMGGFYSAAIINPHPRRCEFRITGRSFSEKPKPQIHIAVAPTKNNDRFEWALEKMTEIGVAQITPVIGARSERKTYKTARGERIIVNALKQSGNLWKPKLNEPVLLRDFIGHAVSGQKFIAHCNRGCGSDRHLLSLASKNTNTIILIGPEGDFTETELQQARDAGFIPCGLGNSRLRTETAAIVACHTLHLLHV